MPGACVLGYRFPVLVTLASKLLRSLEFGKIRSAGYDEQLSKKGMHNVGRKIVGSICRKQ